MHRLEIICIMMKSATAFMTAGCTEAPGEHRQENFRASTHVCRGPHYLQKIVTVVNRLKINQSFVIFNVISNIIDI